MRLLEDVASQAVALPELVHDVGRALDRERRTEQVGGTREVMGVEVLLGLVDERTDAAIVVAVDVSVASSAAVAIASVDVSDAWENGAHLSVMASMNVRHVSVDAVVDIVHGLLAVAITVEVAPLLLLAATEQRLLETEALQLLLDLRDVPLPLELVRGKWLRARRV